MDERNTGDLTGRVAVVTGGASGIGAATVEALAARGAHVAVADLRVDAAEAVAARGSRRRLCVRRRARRPRRAQRRSRHRHRRVGARARRRARELRRAHRSRAPGTRRRGRDRGARRVGADLRRRPPRADAGVQARAAVDDREWEWRHRQHLVELGARRRHGARRIRVGEGRRQQPHAVDCHQLRKAGHSVQRGVAWRDQRPRRSGRSSRRTSRTSWSATACCRPSASRRTSPR